MGEARRRKQVEVNTYRTKNNNSIKNIYNNMLGLISSGKIKLTKR